MKEQKNKKISFSYAKRNGVLIESIEENYVVVVHKANPNIIAINELRRYINLPLKLKQVSSEEFDSLISKAYEKTAHEALENIINEEDLDLKDLINQLPKPEDLLETEDEAPIIRLINAMFTQSIKQNASDIHIETFEDKIIVRFRIDGVLREVLEPPRAVAPLLVSRVKVMAKLNIAEKRLPQDGRISIQIAGRPIDVRVSTLPSSHGERIVLRLLDKKAAKLDLESLGMAEQDLKSMRSLIHRPNGIILVTGPTGSGKTTSLYAALTELNETSRNILTVEDPIEYYLAGIGQTQVNTKIDMTFAKGLRAILRQDPDVVMVGEIRDVETAQIAVQSSLTGHLVLSTLHTNSAVGAITRLRDMGVESFLLATTIICVTAQRLIRLLCEDCKQEKAASEGELELLELSKDSNIKIYDAKGCDQCNFTGFKGRTGIYEVIAIDKELQNMIHEDASEQKMEEYARKFSDSMRQDGFKKIIEGKTTLEEVLRVTSQG